MNIGYLIKFKWHPPNGGASGHAYQVANNLIKRGHQLHTIYYHHPIPDVRVYRQRELFQFLRAIDVLYIRVDGDIGYEIYTLLKLLKFAKLPVVWEINSPLEELLLRGKTEQYVRGLHKKRVFLAKFADAAICVSQANQEYAKERLNIKKTYVVPNGSDPVLFSPEKHNDMLYPGLLNKFKVIWAGSAQYNWHGLNSLNEIAAKVYAQDKDIVFILIGNQRELANRIQAVPNIQIYDKKGYLEIPSYFASADAGLCLYEQDLIGGKFYFSSLKLFDYMASALPIIATRAGQIAEVIQDNQDGILVTSGSDEIAEKILFLKRNTAKARQMGIMARKKIEEFYNWERVGKETEKILKSLTIKN